MAARVNLDAGGGSTQTMKKRIKRIAIYYRSMPLILEQMVAQNDDMRLLKDGVFTCNGVRCPRATMSLDWTGSKADIDRLKALALLLGELEANNQIAAFSIR